MFASDNSRALESTPELFNYKTSHPSSAPALEQQQRELFEKDSLEKLKKLSHNSCESFITLRRRFGVDEEKKLLKATNKAFHLPRSARATKKTLSIYHSFVKICPRGALSAQHCVNIMKATHTTLSKPFCHIFMRWLIINFIIESALTDSDFLASRAHLIKAKLKFIA